MGGIGSGARRARNVGTVEDAVGLDIRVLRRLGVVRAGECVCDTVCWSSSGLRAPSVRLRVDLEAVERGGVLTIAGTMADGPIALHIAIEAVPSRFGGWRCYFVCPVAAKRCEVLYYAAGRFACRKAQRLTYATQGMTELARIKRKATKLRARLCGSNAQPRPRGRHRIEMIGVAEEAEGLAKSMYHERLSAMIEGPDARPMPARR